MWLRNLDTSLFSKLSVALLAFSLCLSSPCVVRAQAQRDASGRPVDTCNYTNFRERVINNALDALFAKMEAYGVQYSRRDENARVTYLGTIQNPTFGGITHFEEVAYRANNGVWYAMHNVSDLTGVPAIDASSFKVAFREPYPKVYRREGRRYLSCVVGFAEGAGMTKAAFKIYSISNQARFIADVLSVEADDYIPFVYRLEILSD